MWTAVMNELRELAWIASMVGGLSVLCTWLAIASAVMFVSVG